MIWRLRASEQPQKNPKIPREGDVIRAVVRGTGGGGGQRQKNLRFDNQGARRLLLGRPPLPHQAYKCYQKHRSVGAIPQAPGRPVRHMLEPVGRRVASEGSLFLVVEINLNSECSRKA